MTKIIGMTRYVRIPRYGPPSKPSCSIVNRLAMSTMLATASAVPIRLIALCVMDAKKFLNIAFLSYG
jgi:hypothetical protein